MASPYKGLQIASATAKSRNERFWFGFSQNVFFMGMMEPQNNFGPTFLGFTPQNRLFCPTPWDQLATLRKLRLYRGGTPIPAKLWPVHYICSTETTLSRGGRGGRLTSLDASWARCFGFFQTSSKTSRSMFFSKHRWNIASLSKKCDVFHDVLGFRKATQSRS